MSDEETRAAEFRRVMRARTTWEYNQRFVARPSDPAALLAFRDRWLPVLDKVRDWDPPYEGFLDAGRGVQVP